MHKPAIGNIGVDFGTREFMTTRLGRCVIVEVLEKAGLGTELKLHELVRGLKFGGIADDGLESRQVLGVEGRQMANRVDRVII